ncbi:hypothetical protein PybrP1_005095 [[Pythium] brassicae (nom. inval.)]|nr:hypothetical protein PybrP1_005095 [[Pythium] brassicae (nom. inval.)]
MLLRVGRLATLGLLLSVQAVAATRDFAVPSVDFPALATSATERAALLSAMQADGILALRNVPGYAPLRAKYLATAAACAVTARDHNAEFLLHRQLADGTERYTISTESGRKLGDAGDETLAHCPGYLAVYREFSGLVEAAVAGVGTALDATRALHLATGTGEPLTARELMEESVHLDHFHAYQAAASGRGHALDDVQLSLEMHTDNGLLIAMSAPEYFDVAASGEVRARQTRREDAGLFIQTAAGETVRPVLVADELVLMLGSGADQWVTARPALRPVVHGMRFPHALSYADDATAHKLLRAWFGKMVLLNADHVMQNTGMSFGEYANRTTRYLLEAGADLDFAAAACPPTRRLQASDTKCMTKTCTLKAGADATGMPESCQVTCNHESVDDEKLCQKNCECAVQSAAGHRCWMLCVADLAADVCPGAQKCNSEYIKSKLGMSCVAGTAAPRTPAPSTATSTIPSPSSAKPATAKPATAKPATAKPSTSAGSASRDGNAKVSTAPINAGDTSRASSSVNNTTLAGNSSTPTPTPTNSGVGATASLAVGVASVLLSAVLVLVE